MKTCMLIISLLFVTKLLVAKESERICDKDVESIQYFFDHNIQIFIDAVNRAPGTISTSGEKYSHGMSIINSAGVVSKCLGLISATRQGFFSDSKCNTAKTKDLYIKKCEALKSEYAVLGKQHLAALNPLKYKMEPCDLSLVELSYLRKDVSREIEDSIANSNPVKCKTLDKLTGMKKMIWLTDKFYKLTYNLSQLLHGQMINNELLQRCHDPLKNDKYVIPNHMKNIATNAYIFETEITKARNILDLYRENLVDLNKYQYPQDCNPVNIDSSDLDLFSDDIPVSDSNSK